ncbi:MAG: hypothetical protein JWQ79_310 [Mucilaginibacter sp.]|nr:hypothetical protein [Mucilaginibacter sp.]
MLCCLIFYKAAVIFDLLVNSTHLNKNITTPYMEKKKKSVLLVMILLSFFSIKSVAQKLSNIQLNSLRLAANLKIDGKATEWDNKFQAHNNATELFYTIANDDNNLYLLIRADKPRIIQKIISVGVTFVIDVSNKRKIQDPQNITITYPQINVNNGMLIISKAGAKAEIITSLPETLRDTSSTLTITDSLINVANMLFTSAAKTIKVKRGLRPDSSISIYNEERIRVGASFDKGTYTYELLIPLKFLKLTSNDIQEFNYNVRLKSRLDVPKQGMRVRYIYPNGVMTDVDQDLDSTTDFWGKYILAKK